MVEVDGKVEFYTDGASRGNPGLSACSFICVKKDLGFPIVEYAEFLGKTTNNVAEYMAIVRALSYAVNVNLDLSKVVVYSDSELVVNQINGKYKTNKEHLKDLLDAVNNLKFYFEEIEFKHVPRTNKYIKVCDSLCNKKLDDFK